jgi:Flp pilus assembly protein TadG
MTGRVRRLRRSGDNEQGTAIVEAAIAGVLFFMVVFAIIDFSMAYYAKNSVQNISLSAARTAAAQANAVLADYSTLVKVEEAQGSLPNSQLQAVVIYKASGPSSKISAGCKTASSAASFCNYYTIADLARPDTDFGCGAGSPDRYWCPTTRQAASSYTGGATPGPEYIGVYVKGSFTSLTGAISNKTFETDTIIRIEPRIK